VYWRILILLLPVLSILLFFSYWRLKYFFRDPERSVPSGRNIVSPADGTVVYVKSIKNGQAPVATKQGKDITLEELARSPVGGRFDSGYLIGIFMSLFDVHVNRTPVSGVVESISHYRSRRNWSMWRMGMKKLLRRKEIYSASNRYLLENERNTILIDGTVPVCVVQIADSYVDRIECWIRRGQKVRKGQRIGRIVMGSQVDVMVPAADGVKIEVKEGQHVCAGETILASLD